MSKVKTPPYPGVLTEECGHHCGVLTTGKHQHVGHCQCKECHGRKPKRGRPRKKKANET